MSGQRIELEREVRASADRVWEVLTDIEHAPQTLSGVERVEMVTEGPYRVGTTWKETRKMFGKEATEQMQVTAVEAPTRTVVEAESAGVHYVSEFTLTPATPELTRLVMTFAAQQQGAGALQKVLWRVFGGLGVKATQRMMVKDLHDIAARAEQS